MCEPTTIALVLLAASTAMTVKSSMDQADYQKDLGKANAKSAEYAAKDAIDRGVVAEDQKRNETRAKLATQNAALAANGIDTASGTGLALLQDTAGFGEFDAQTIRSNAMKQAYGIKQQGDNAKSNAFASAAATKNQGYATLLASGSKAYGMMGAGASSGKASFGSGGMGGFGDSFSTSYGE